MPLAVAGARYFTCLLFAQQADLVVALVALVALVDLASQDA